MYQKTLYTIFLFILCLPFVSHGQSTAALTLNPSYPEAGEDYTASITSPLDPNATIRWLINGTEQTAFKNQRSVTLTAKGLGVSETILAEVVGGDSTLVRASRKVTPVRVDLLITADTLTPLFYKGRKLGSSGSDMTATAQVFLGSPKDTGTLTYVWSVGNRVQNGGVASTNSAITFSSGFEDELLVAVTVYKNGVAIAEKSVFVPITKPELYFYEKNLLRGLSTVALKKAHVFIGEELLMRAEPYFVDRDLASANVRRTWKIDNREVAGNETDPYELSLQKEGRGGGAEVSFSLQNIAKLLQGVRGSIGVQF